jgi:hypothetical protein
MRPTTRQCPIASEARAAAGRPQCIERERASSRWPTTRADMLVGTGSSCHSCRRQQEPSGIDAQPMDLEILPLAITMMVGPQIMSAILFVTTPRAIQTSAGFLVGVAAATSAGVAIALWLANLIGDSLGDSNNSGSLGRVIQYGLVALLVARAIQNYLGRKTAEPPKWLGTLLTADWKRALKTGLLLASEGSCRNPAVGAGTSECLPHSPRPACGSAPA